MITFSFEKFNFVNFENLTRKQKLLEGSRRNWRKLDPHIQ